MRAFEFGGGGGGSESDSAVRQAILRDLVAGLDELNNPNAVVNKPGSDDLTLALHEEDSRSIVLWATLRPFLRAYSKAFPIATPLTEEELEANIDVALNESEFFLTQELIKRHLRNLGPLSLGGLAEFRFPRTKHASWERYQRTLTREIFDPMRDLKLWHVETIARPDNGGGSIAGYWISAGQALIDFHDFVFEPRRREQHQRFYEKHIKKLEEKRHA
jgi:hypothetical protein